MRDTALRSKAAATRLMAVTEVHRQAALRAIADALEAQVPALLATNAQDVADGKAIGLSAALIDRLTLTDKSVRAMAQACRDIAAAPAVVGMFEEERRRPDGLVIQKQRIPLGVIAMVFESRPNVVVDGAALAVKSGNAILLKGGKEAVRSNKFLGELVRAAIAPHLPADAVQMVEGRDEVTELLKLGDLVDLVVPRGGEALIKFVRQHATMPVVAHDRGLCHVYLHPDADPDQARDIVLNAKTQRPGVCNAMETLLVHRDFPRDALIGLLEDLKGAHVEIHACPATVGLVSGLVPAGAADFHTEWLDLKMSLRQVPDANAALEHIRTHGSHHTEAVLTRTPAVAELFLNGIDASCLAINASTRFNDGSELGLGAELGISTSKLHAYGPMGAREMTTTRFVVRGAGHVRK